MAKLKRTSSRPSDPSESPLTVVGIGASAGGLAALKTFFQHVPADSGLAYVIVVHLAPDHESHLAELLQPHVRMPVRQVAESTTLAANQVYVIPPGRNLSAVDTHLRLTDLEKDRRERAPIDHFLRTLAATHDGASVGVILTGTGSDGALGVTAIKGKNGLVVVQDPADAEHDGMPQSAVATGLADLVLPLAEIPEAILRFARTQPRVVVPEDGEDADGEERQLLQKIFVQIRTRTGRDFTHYKRATILRRIARRMQLRSVEELPAYLALLRERPDEVQALADDLLVTVTSFFRDPEVYATLAAEVVPRLFDGKRADDDLRVWSVGCATGEEAYSLAILLLEEAARRDVTPRLQIFASDLHDHSLARAREGFYPGDIATDVGAERLERFFAREDGGYRIRKEVREIVVFAPHNVLADPPFSKLDLVTCRNVLIYLQRGVQREIVELFHYALKPNGFVVLGASEAIDGTELFQVVDKKRCVYRKRNVPAPEPRLPVFPLTRWRHVGPRARAAREQEPPMAHAQLHQRLAERYAPPSLLLSPDDNVVHLSAQVGRYLGQPGGEPTTNVYRLVREELRFELRSLVTSAREHNAPQRSRPIAVSVDGKRVPVVVHVRPATEPHEEGFALVIFDEREPESESVTAPEPTPADGARARELEAEVTLVRHRLQSTVEEFETSQEELRASNEEFQSANEELRSTLEELETSKEELQSINEELQTVNQENRHRVEELRQLNDDLQNLLVATDIATLFLDRDLRILRFTPQVGALFNVRPADRGRPLSDLTHRIGYPTLQADARRVLETLAPIAHEVQDDADHWYLARLLPYRSAQHRIDGVVLTFVDITTQKRAEQALRASEMRLRRMMNVEGVGVLLFDAVTGTLLDASDGFLRMSGYSRAQVASRTLTWRSMTPPEHVAASEAQLEALADTGRIGPYEKEHLRADGSRVWMLFSGTALGDGTIVEYCLDVSDRKRAEEALRESEARLAHDLEATQILQRIGDELISKPDVNGHFHEFCEAARALMRSDCASIQVYDEGSSRLQLVGHVGFHPDSAAFWEWVDAGVGSSCGRALATGERVIVPDTDRFEADPPDLEAFRQSAILSVQSTPLVARTGQVVGMMSTHWHERDVPAETSYRFFDILARLAADFIVRIRAEAALRESEEKYRNLFEWMGQGYSPNEVVRDAEGGAIDLRYLELNPAFERLTGASRSQARGRLASEVFPGLDRYWVDICDRAVRTGVIERVEHELTPNGRWYQSNFYPIGRDRVLSLYDDITDRKRAEIALRESEERQAFLLKVSDALRPLADPLAVIATASELVGRYLDAGRCGYGELPPPYDHFVVERDWTNGMPSHRGRWRLADFGDAFVSENRAGRTLVIDDALADERSEGAMDALQAAGGLRASIGVPLIKDGKWVAAFFVHDSKPRRWRKGDVELVEEVAERTWGAVEKSRAEAALRESEARYRTLVDNVRDYAIFLLDADGVITEWTPGAERVTGYAADEAVGQHFALFYPPEDAAAGLPGRELAEAAAAGRGEWEGWRVRKDGRRFWANEIATVVRDAGGRVIGFTKIARDLTEQRLAAEVAEQGRLAAARDELRRALSAAEEAERRRLARELHDQLGQHLTGFALGLTEVRRRIAAGESAAERLDQLETLARLMTRDARSLALELRPPELDDVGLESALDTYVREWSARHGIAAELAVMGPIDDAVPPEVGSALYRIVQEALTNVARHAGATQVSVIMEKPDGEVRLLVEDDGRGFDVDATATRVRAERRLGLAGMRERAALVGGTLAVESTPGAGTTLQARIPVGEVKTATPAPDTAGNGRGATRV